MFGNTKKLIPNFNRDKPGGLGWWFGGDLYTLFFAMLGTVIEIRLVLNSCWFRFHPLNCKMLCTVEAGVGPPTTPAPWPAAFQGVLARSIGCLQPTSGFAGIHGPIEVWPQAGGVPQVLEAASRSRSCWANAPCLLEDVAGHVREAGRAGCMGSRGGWALKGPWLPGHSVDHGVSGQGETWWYGPVSSLGR